MCALVTVNKSNSFVTDVCDVNTVCPSHSDCLSNVEAGVVRVNCIQCMVSVCQ